eukprot:5198050-Alexandrium_andersonii.AAC.1
MSTHASSHHPQTVDPSQGIQKQARLSQQETHTQMPTHANANAATAVATAACAAPQARRAAGVD